MTIEVNSNLPRIKRHTKDGCKRVRVGQLTTEMSLQINSDCTCCILQDGGQRQEIGISHTQTTDAGDLRLVRSYNTY